MSALVKKPAIGKVDIHDRALYAMKERLEQISGERGDTIVDKLPEDADLQDVIVKINELINLLQ
jgi:hypothetical protein